MHLHVKNQQKILKKKKTKTETKASAENQNLHSQRNSTTHIVQIRGSHPDMDNIIPGVDHLRSIREVSPCHMDFKIESVEFLCTDFH